MKLRPMRGTPGELDRVDRLLMTAYDSRSRRRQLAHYVNAQPDGWFVMADGDDVIAVAGAISYGTFCWLGLVGTRPAYRRQGLATGLSAHLITWARERGCATVALDASEAGRPVYERLGFHATGSTCAWAAKCSPAAATGSSLRRAMRPDKAPNSFAAPRASAVQAGWVPDWSRAPAHRSSYRQHWSPLPNGSPASAKAWWTRLPRTLGSPG